jgi:hypothetical protein
LFKAVGALDIRRQLPLNGGDGLRVLRLGDGAGMFPGLYRPVTLGDRGAGGGPLFGDCASDRPLALCDCADPPDDAVALLQRAVLPVKATMARLNL